MTEEPLFENLQRIDLGNGVAEHDNLLWKCMVETQHFRDLLHDRIDLVLGSKGAGKSSLFRMFGELLQETLLTKWSAVVVSGVETKGDPIFKGYSAHFQSFSEEQFETFWKAYLLSLVYNRLVHDERVNPLFSIHTAEWDEFTTAYSSLGIVDVGRIGSPTKLLKLVCALTIAAIEGVNAAWDTEKNQIVIGVQIREKLKQGFHEVIVPSLSAMDTVICIDALSRLARVSKYKIWMFLDHLDVVFRRRSSEEALCARFSKCPNRSRPITSV